MAGCDFQRFTRPTSLSAYLGLAPSENTSAGKRRQGSITKAGSTLARRLLVEASYGQSDGDWRSVFGYSCGPARTGIFHGLFGSRADRRNAEARIRSEYGGEQRTRAGSGLGIRRAHLPRVVTD